jgi:hypothetical protein
LKEVKDLFSGVGGAIMLDLWSDVYRKINYLGVTVHYTVNGQLKDRVLCTTEFDSDMKKTRDNIKIEIIKILRSFHLHNIIDKVVFTTDRESNIVVALRQFTILSCSAHILNTVLEHTTWK